MYICELKILNKICVARSWFQFTLSLFCPCFIYIFYLNHWRGGLDTIHHFLAFVTSFIGIDEKLCIDVNLCALDFVLHAIIFVLWPVDVNPKIIELHCHSRRSYVSWKLSVMFRFLRCSLDFVLTGFLTVRCNWFSNLISVAFWGRHWFQNPLFFLLKFLDTDKFILYTSFLVSNLIGPVDGITATADAICEI